MNLNEPRGWKCLQEMAQSAPDTQTLSRIIDEMNRVLDDEEESRGMGLIPAVSK